MIKGERRVAIVTGSSSGIGEHTAYALADRGYSLVLAARRVERLEEVAARCRQRGVTAMAIPTDVAQADQVRALVERAVAELGRLDVMVNNAGYGLFATFENTSVEQMRAMFEVNFYGVVHGAQAAIPVMRRQGGGHIFNVSSVIGKRGSPFHSAYCATKFALVGIGDCMRVELKRDRILVTTVCPALTDTEFFSHTGSGRSARASFEKFRGLTRPEVVARKIATSVGKNRPELVFTLGGKILAKIAALSPRTADWMMGTYYRDVVQRMQADGTTPGPDSAEGV